MRIIQRALNDLASADLAVDGRAGAKTRAAYAVWERTTSSRNQDGIPGPESLTQLGRRRFRVTGQ